MNKFKEFISEATTDLMRLGGMTETNNLLDHSKLMGSKAWKWHNKAFGDKHHIEMPLPAEVPPAVVDHVTSKGGKIDDTGHKVELESGRVVPTSKFLGKSNAPQNVVSEYQHHLNHASQNGNTKLVISKKPGEVASCSTGTHWSSCADFSKGEDGIAKDYLPDELKHGTMIAMHLHKDAKPNSAGEYESKDILGRRLIKHHETEDGDTAYHQEQKSYGQFPKSAISKVEEFTRKHNPKHFIADKHSDVYDDDGKKLKSMIDKDNIEDAMKSPNHIVRMNAAGSVHAKSEHLDTLFKDHKRIVRMKAVGNPNASPELIHKGLDSPDVESQDEAASNPTAKMEHLNKAFSSESRFVRGAAVLNPNANSELIHKGIDDDEEHVNQRAAKNPNLTPEHIHKILSKNEDNDYWAKVYAAEHKNASLDNLKLALKSDNAGVYNAAAPHKNLDTHTLGKIINSKDVVKFSHGLVSNPNLNKEHVTALLEHPAIDDMAKRILCGHENFDSSHISKALDDDELAHDAITNKNASQGNLIKALKNRDSDVRKYAQKKLNK